MLIYIHVVVFFTFEIFFSLKVQKKVRWAGGEKIERTDFKQIKKNIFLFYFYFILNEHACFGYESSRGKDFARKSRFQFSPTKARDDGRQAEEAD